MIKNQWYAVLESSEVRPGKLVGVTRMGEKLVFWRDEQGRVSCLRDRCPHRGVALSTGKVVDGDALECPFHGFRFDRSGQCTLVPANGRAAPLPKQIRAFSYPIWEGHGFIFLWYGEGQPTRPEPLFFDNLDSSLTYASARDPWDAHYARVIENQLDAAHVPFIHATTIGRGGRVVVDGPLVEWNNPDQFTVYVFNRLDNGSRAKRADELERPDVPFHLEFIFPNLWQNYISHNVRVLAAFAPVDDEHCMLYLRFYQNFLRIPVLRDMVNRLAMPFNVLVAHQDRRVVVTQEPKRPDLRIGEKLVQSDGPIIQYRKRRHELISCEEAVALQPR